jgi:hypothetical protein
MACMHLWLLPYLPILLTLPALAPQAVLDLNPYSLFIKVGFTSFVKFAKNDQIHIVSSSAKGGYNTSVGFITVQVSGFFGK